MSVFFGRPWDTLGANVGGDLAGVAPWYASARPLATGCDCRGLGGVLEGLPTCPGRVFATANKQKGRPQLFPQRSATHRPGEDPWPLC